MKIIIFILNPKTTINWLIFGFLLTQEPSNLSIHFYGYRGMGNFIEIEVSQEIYDIYIYDKYKEEQKELYRNTHLQDYTDLNILEDSLVSSKNDLDIFLDDMVLMDEINKVLEQCTKTQKDVSVCGSLRRKRTKKLPILKGLNISLFINLLTKSEKNLKNFFQKGS